MLSSQVRLALTRHIDDLILNLPALRERYKVDVEGSRQAGLEDIAEIRTFIERSIIHNLTHESVMIFARNTQSKFPTESERQEMIKLINNRGTDIRSAIAELDWV